jgi:hypothetical protein
MSFFISFDQCRFEVYFVRDKYHGFFLKREVLSEQTDSAMVMSSPNIIIAHSILKDLMRGAQRQRYTLLWGLRSRDSHRSLRGPEQ